jgi:hypothetical protein
MIISTYTPLIELEGESYTPLKRLVIYSLFGNAVKKNIIRQGEFLHDTRVHFASALRAGYGKSTIKRFLRDVITAEGYTFSEPTSLHPEQLVGTVHIHPMTGEPKKVFGHLADDYLIIDEALEVLTHKEYEIARSYLNIALDPIGTNVVVKRQVAIEREEAIKYCPECTVGFFFHPVRIPDQVVYRGFFRRVFVVYISPSEIERELALANSMTRVINWDLFNELVAKLKELRQKKIEWKFVSYNPIIRYSKQLIEEGFNFSSKVADITDIMWFSLRDRLVKLSAILAAINNDGVIDEKAIINAYKDMYQFWRSQCYFAEDYVMLTPSYVQRQMRIRTVIDVLVQHSATSVNPVDYELVASHLTKILQVSYGLAKYLLDELITQGILSAVNTDRGKMVYLRANDDEYNKILTRYYGVK